MFLLPISRQERVMLLTTLRALADASPCWEDLRDRLDELSEGTPGEQRRKEALLAQVDTARLDWEWLDGLREALGPERWSEADVLELVMHANRRELWQPRTAA